MRAATRWQIVAVAAGALLAGSLIGQPIVRAATAGLVTIQGGTSTSKSAVTKANQLETTEASGSSLVSERSFANCTSSGFYTVPAGKALIITGVNFYHFNETGSGSQSLSLEAGPVGTPCLALLAGGVTVSDTAQNQSYQPGIAVPAGSALGLAEDNDDGSVQVYGYLVPQADVPANALQHFPRGGPLATAGHRG